MQPCPRPPTRAPGCSRPHSLGAVLRRERMAAGMQSQVCSGDLGLLRSRPLGGGLHQPSQHFLRPAPMSETVFNSFPLLHTGHPLPHGAGWPSLPRTLSFSQIGVSTINLLHIECYLGDCSPVDRHTHWGLILPLLSLTEGDSRHCTWQTPQLVALAQTGPWAERRVLATGQHIHRDMAGHRHFVQQQ